VKNDLSLPFCMLIFGGAQDKILSVKQGRTRDHIPVSGLPSV